MRLARRSAECEACMSHLFGRRSLDQSLSAFSDFDENDESFYDEDDGGGGPDDEEEEESTGSTATAAAAPAFAEDLTALTCGQMLPPHATPHRFPINQLSG